MGTKIDMVAVTGPSFRLFSNGSIDLSGRAAKECLINSKVDPSDIGLLINTGIYRYKNTGEPAIAALIQKKIGANTSEKKKLNDNRTTFSFDLNNGGCGLLTGIQIADNFLQTGNIDHAMVVTGDSEPFRGLSENYNFESAAASLILSRSEDPGGFSLFRSYSFPEYDKELISSTYYGNFKRKRGNRNILSVKQKETYLDLCTSCAEESLKKFMNEAAISSETTDLIISSQSPQGFVSKMKIKFGMSSKFIEIAKNNSKEFHTAGMAFALKKAWDENRFRTSVNIVFLTVGSGINVSLALYHNVY